jgi:hypothetical protein
LEPVDDGVDQAADDGVCRWDLLQHTADPHVQALEDRVAEDFAARVFAHARVVPDEDWSDTSDTGLSAAPYRPGAVEMTQQQQVQERAWLARALARAAAEEAGAEAAHIEGLRECCLDDPAVGQSDDRGMAASLYRQGKGAWIRVAYVRAAAARAKGDPVQGPRANRAVARAQRDARAIVGLAAHVGTRAARRVRVAAQARVGVRVVRRPPRRSGGLCRSHRIPARRARASVAASAAGASGPPPPETDCTRRPFAEGGAV